MWNSCQIKQISLQWPEEFKGDIGQIIPSFHGNDSLAHSTQVHRKVGQHLAGQMSLTAVPEGSADI